MAGKPLSPSQSQSSEPSQRAPIADLPTGGGRPFCFVLGPLGVDLGGIIVIGRILGKVCLNVRVGKDDQ
jgi:hypothetical protein